MTPAIAPTSRGLDQVAGASTAGTTVPRRCDVEQLAGLLDSPEIARLVADLEATRWTGRPGYPMRALVGMALAKSLYALPTWTRTVALVTEHAALRAALGCASANETPSVYFLLSLRRQTAGLQAVGGRLHRSGARLAAR